MNVVRRFPSWLALAGFCLAGAAGTAHGQVVLGDLQERALPFGDGVFFQPDEAASLAIGDPWWDDAAPEPQAGDAPAAPVEEPGDDEAEAADPQAQMQAQLQAQAEMLRQGIELQGLAILRRELSVVRHTCPSLEKQQRALVLQAGRQAIEKLADEQMATLVGRRRGRAADMEATIGEEVRTSVAANAAAAESDAYAAERGLRQERVRQATIAALVADVDRDAFLDEAERTALAAALAAAYRDRWRPAATSLEQGMTWVAPAPLPGVERCVEKALGKERTAEWLARRAEARQLLADAAETTVEDEMAVGGLRRVIRRQVDGKMNRVQIRIEVRRDDVKLERVGGAGPAAPEADDAEEDEK